MVSRLVLDAERHPEKLEKLHRKRELKEREKDAIEDAAQNMLKNNVPIFKAQQIVD